MPWARQGVAPEQWWGSAWARHWWYHRHAEYGFAPPRGGRGGPFGRPFGDDPFGDGDGPRRRRRGDIRFAILEVLAEQPRHGYEVIKELERRYGGFYRPSPGSVYPTLQLLEDEGHLTSELRDGKRVYTITDSGRVVLQETRAQRGPQGGNERRDGGVRPGPELHALRGRALALMHSVMEVGRHGTPEQVRAALDVLDDTRRALYRILGGSDAPHERDDVI
jgi:DNA-binding PadR family transcriptional regulator